MSEAVSQKEKETGGVSGLGSADLEFVDKQTKNKHANKDPDQELHRVFSAQRKAHLANPYPSAKEREDRINRLIDLVVSHEQRLIDALNADFGRRSARHSRILDILPAIQAAKYSRKHLRRWMKAEKRSSLFPLGLLGARSKVQYLPLGVVGNISPWNVPIQVSMRAAVDIFAAGNRTMLKPSEYTPFTVDLLAELVGQHFDETEFAVISGGPDIATAFSNLPFDHLIFTGSTEVGRKVAQSAASNLVPTTLELGGKNPTIVSQTADLKEAAEKIIWSKTANGGQICLCPDIVYVHESQLADFVEFCGSEIKRQFPSFAESEDYIHMISQRHADRLKTLADDAKSRGAEILSFEETTGTCVPLSLVIDPPADARLMREEIFGGLLAIVPYDDYREIGARVNAGAKPLTLTYLGSDKTEIDFFECQVLCGGMVINDYFFHCSQEDLPFGGVGASGTGSYHGFDGFKNFSHAKAVFKQSPLDPMRVTRPPFGKGLDRFLKSQIKK